MFFEIMKGFTTSAEEKVARLGQRTRRAVSSFRQVKIEE